jgi:hypothetical protein
MNAQHARGDDFLGRRVRPIGIAVLVQEIADREVRVDNDDVLQHVATERFEERVPGAELPETRERSGIKVRRDRWN